MMSSALYWLKGLPLHCIIYRQYTTCIAVYVREVKKKKIIKTFCKILNKITPSTSEDKTFCTILYKIQILVQYRTTTKKLSI